MRQKWQSQCVVEGGRVEAAAEAVVVVVVPLRSAANNQSSLNAPPLIAVAVAVAADVLALGLCNSEVVVVVVIGTAETGVAAEAAAGSGGGGGSTAPLLPPLVSALHPFSICHRACALITAVSWCCSACSCALSTEFAGELGGAQMRANSTVTSVAQRLRYCFQSMKQEIE
jgi:hypothetical protein